MILTYYQLSVFFLIFARFSGLVLISPFFSMKSLFSLAKVSFVFWVSVLIMFVVPLPQSLPNSLFIYFFALMIELVIGLIIGFTANLIMMAIEFGGAIMDTQAGLSSASVLDPTSGKNAALLELLMKYLAIMLFLIINGHHMVLSAVFESFSIMPLGQPVDFSAGSQYLVSLGSALFLIGLKLAAPIILVIFIVDFSFGILNKVAEQVNVFQLGFQVKPMVAVIIFLGIAPNFGNILVGIIETVMNSLVTLLGFFVT
mgnify:CR=1 FL=1|tara:strand:- start:584 stop:1354 length:771 start_codon:yes stop_codon:yes gene_type:complete